MGTCYIVGAGECAPLNIFKLDDDMLIAADGGYISVANAGLVADIIIGDFDSAPVPAGDNVIILNPIKDDTDMMAAVKYGIDKGYEKFVLYGATGGRTAHTLANIQLMHKLKTYGMQVEIIGKTEIMRCIQNEKVAFDKESRGYVSVFSLSERCEGVDESGLKYRLDNYTLANDNPLGVSNEFTGEQSYISVKEGMMLIIYTHEAKII